MAQESRLAIIIDSRRAQVDAETLAKTMRTLEDHGVRVTKSNADVSASMDRMASDANAAATSIRRGLVAALGGLSAMAVIDIADDWGQYASRMRMATKSTEEYEHAQSRMLASAQTTYRAINETRESFIQLSPVLRDIGLSLDQSIDAIDAFSGLLVINSASAERGAAAMSAYSKSLQKGRVDAQSWETIATTMPSIIELIAKSTQKTEAEVRSLGANGKLSIQELTEALVKSLSEITKRVDGMPTTVRDAMQNISSAFGEYIGTINEANQITATMAEGLDFLGVNLELVLTSAIVGATVGLGRYTGGLVAATSQTALKVVQTRRAAVEELKLAEAQVVTTTAALAQARALGMVTANMAQQTAAATALEAAEKRLLAAKMGLARSSTALLGALGGPVGLGVTAALTAASFLVFRDGTDEASRGAEGLAQKIDILTEAAEKLTAAQAQQAIENLAEPYRKAKEEVMLYEAQIETLTKSLHDFPSSAMAKEWNEALIQARGNADTARQALEPYTARLAELQARLAAVTGAQDDLNLALGKLPDAVQRQMDTLDRQIALFGKTGQAAQYYYDLEHGSLKDLDASLKKEFRARVDVLAAQEKDAEARARSTKATRAEQKEIERIIQSLESQVSVLGMTEQQAERYRIEITKGTQAQKAQALALLDQKHAHEAAERATKLHTEALRDQRNLAAELDIFRNQQALPITGMGLGERRREQLAAEYAVQEEFARRRRELDEAQRVESTKLDEKLYQEQIRYLRDAEEKKIEILREYAAYRLFAERNWVTGMGESLINYANDAANVYESLGGVVSNSFRGMEDALSTLVKNGKLDFSSFADSIISDLIRISVQQSILGPIAGALGGMFGGGGFSSSGPIAGSALQSNGLTGVRVPGFSDGGFTGIGGRYEPAGIVHKGEGVLSQDEIRKLGGESGFNALRRAISGPGHSMGGMAGRPMSVPAGAFGSGPNINVNITGVTSQPEVSARRNQAGGFDIDIMFKQIENRMAGGIASGQGKFSQALERRYALKPQLG